MLKKILSWLVVISLLVATTVSADATEINKNEYDREVKIYSNVNENQNFDDHTILVVIDKNVKQNSRVF